MYYSQEQIDRANQTNMEDFLRSQGETLIRLSLIHTQRKRIPLEMSRQPDGTGK